MHFSCERWPEKQSHILGINAMHLSLHAQEDSMLTVKASAMNSSRMREKVMPAMVANMAKIIEALGGPHDSQVPGRKALKHCPCGALFELLHETRPGDNLALPRLFCTSIKHSW